MSTADKLLSALPLFTTDKAQWTIDEAAGALGVSPSTAYRYFSSLTRAGLLDPLSGGRYVLGPAIIAYDRQLRRQDPILEIARPAMERLVKRNGSEGMALLCRRFRNEVMCVYQAFEGEFAHAVSYERGRPMGLYRGAASLVILANLPGRALQARWTADRATIVEAGLGESWEAFRKGLRRIRTTRVCVTHGQLDSGMVGISAPIFHTDRSVAGSVSMVVVEAETDAVGIAGTSALVDAAAREIDSGMQILLAS